MISFSLYIMYIIFLWNLLICDILSLYCRTDYEENIHKEAIYVLAISKQVDQYEVEHITWNRRSINNFEMPLA